MTPNARDIPEGAVVDALWREGEQLVGALGGSIGVYPTPNIVSDDDGATWRLERCARRYCGPPIVAGDLVIRNGDPQRASTEVLRSTDGHSWQRVIGGVCPVSGDDESQSGFHDPVPFGGGWLVLYRCTERITTNATVLGGPRFLSEYVSDVYTVSADGRVHSVVGWSHLRRRDYGAPVVLSDHVVVPIADRGKTIAFASFTPG